MVKRIAVIILAISLVGCLAPEYTTMTNVDVSSWEQEAKLIYQNRDTLSRRNLGIALCYNNNFDEKVLPIKLGITTPDNRSFVDTIELQLHRPMTAQAVVASESVPYRTDVVFSQSGEYTFSFEPLAKVRGMVAIGIELK